MPIAGAMPSRAMASSNMPIVFPVFILLFLLSISPGCAQSADCALLFPGFNSQFRESVKANDRQRDDIAQGDERCRQEHQDVLDDTEHFAPAFQLADWNLC